MADDERDRKAYEAIADAAESAAGQDAKAHGGEHCWAGRVATGIAAAARRRGGTSTGPAQGGHARVLQRMGAHLRRQARDRGAGVMVRFDPPPVARPVLDSWREQLLDAARIPATVGGEAFTVPDEVLLAVTTCPIEQGEDMALYAMAQWSKEIADATRRQSGRRALAIRHVTAFAEAFLAIQKAKRS